MKTINYITYDPWWDTDKTILPILAQDYVLNVVVISPLNDKKYELKKQYGKGSFTEIIQKYRDRDIRSLFIAFRTFWAIKKKANQKKDVFWFIPGSNPFFQMLMYWYLPKGRTIITYHDYTPHFFGDSLADSISKLYARIKYKFCSKFEHFLFYSDIQRCNFEDDFSFKKTAVCNMPLKDFGAYKKNSNILKTFLFFGAIQEYKRLDLFVDAAISCTGNAQFIIAGKPTFDCKSIIDKVKDNSRFICDIGFIKDEDVLSYFEKADYLVLPYTDATQSGPLLIALNYGIPVVASDITVFKEFITDSENGFIFESGSLDGLTKAFNTAISLSEEDYNNMIANQLNKKSEYKEKTNPLLALKELFGESV